MPLHFIQKHPKAKALSTFPFSRSQGAASHLLFIQRAAVSQKVPTVFDTASEMLILNTAVLTKSILQFTKTKQNTNPNAFSTRKTLCPGNSVSI